ncbi:hypothetical protein ACROYT_G031605 [Oculina patagonica]
MKDIKSLVFILLRGMVNVVVYAAEEQDFTSSRSSYLKMWENQRLEGHVVEHLESLSLLSCSHLCLRISWCTSTNVEMSSDKNGKGTCELNKHGAIDANTEFHERQGVTFSMLLKGCLMTGCLNGGSCVHDEKIQTFSCSCKEPWDGEKCELIKINASSRDEAQIKTNQTLLNGKYLLTNRSVPLKVYCHMTNDSKGWTLIARFSNNDDKNWMEDTGYWWYDKQIAMGTTTDPSVNTDAISPAFWLVSGREFKITRSDDPSHTPLLQTTGNCLAGQTFRSKITSYGDFRNGKVWGSNKCLGNCTVEYGGQYKSTHGFEQAECNGIIQCANGIGFWCHWRLDGSVMMIGGGGGGLDSCKRADHGIGITETNAGSFGPEKGSHSKNQGEYDFGFNAYTYNHPAKDYSLNLWIC